MQAVSDIIRTTLGPRSMLKMLLDPMGASPKHSARDPKPETRDPKPETRDPKPETRDPKPET